MISKLVSWYNDEKINNREMNNQTLFQIVGLIFVGGIALYVWSQIFLGNDPTFAVNMAYALVPAYSAAITIPSDKNKISYWGGVNVLLGALIIVIWLLLTPVVPSTSLWANHVYSIWIELLGGFIFGVFGAQLKKPEQTN